MNSFFLFSAKFLEFLQFVEKSGKKVFDAQVRWIPGDESRRVGVRPCL